MVQSEFKSYRNLAYQASNVLKYRYKNQIQVTGLGPKSKHHPLTEGTKYACIYYLR